MHPRKRRKLIRNLVETPLELLLLLTISAGCFIIVLALGIVAHSALGLMGFN